MSGHLLCVGNGSLFAYRQASIWIFAFTLEGIRSTLQSMTHVTIQSSALSTFTEAGSACVQEIGKRDKDPRLTKLQRHCLSRLASLYDRIDMQTNPHVK